jgi:hypothetical protein
MRKTISLIVLFLIITIRVNGQAYEPLDLAKKIFSPDSLIGIENYITGEYQGRPNGQDLQKGTQTKFLSLGETEDKSVIAMTILDSAGNGLDTYLYFQKDTNWKMSAFRSLAMTGIIEQIKAELEKMTPQQVDDMIKKSNKRKKNSHSSFKSREEYDFQLGNAKLTLELDDNILKHFVTNKEEFERLKNLALIQLGNEKFDEGSIKLIESSKGDYQKLFISSVSTGEFGQENCLSFLIGGMLDNTVGYIYVKDKKYLPSMSANKIIMIREIGNGWYIYKTT